MIRYFRAEFNLIAPIIRDWDPEGLLRMGAPQDEYDLEAETLAHSGYRCTDEQTTAQVIGEIFHHYFGNEPHKCRPDRYQPDNLKEIAARIWKVFQSLETPKFL